MWLSVLNGKLSLRVRDLVSRDPSQPEAQSWASLSRHLEEQGGRLSGWSPSWAAVPDGQAPAAHHPQAGPGAPPLRSGGLRTSFWGPLPREGAGTLASLPASLLWHCLQAQLLRGPSSLSPCRPSATALCSPLLASTLCFYLFNLQSFYCLWKVLCLLVYLHVVGLASRLPTPRRGGQAQTCHRSAPDVGVVPAR